MKNHPLKQRIGKFFQKFFLIDDTPHKIAAGAAVGIFMGIVPGEGFISALLVSTIFRFNRLAATLGVLASNMWTTLAVLPLAATIGGLIFHVSPQSLIDSSRTTLASGIGNFFNFTLFFRLIVPVMVGYIIAAALIALVFYLIIYFLLKNRKINLR